MEVVNITNANFDMEVLYIDKPALLYFYTEWSEPCKTLFPILEEIARENPHIKVAKINIDVAREIATQYRVVTLPTIIIIKNTEEIKRIMGIVSKETILNMLNNIQTRWAS